MITVPDIAVQQHQVQPSRRSRFAGLVDRKERWSLSGRGWFVALVVGVLAVVAFFVRLHPFLALTSRADTDVLVVEGWLPNYALEECIAEFRSKPYKLVVTVGCQILTGVNVEPGDNQASYAAKRLQWLGLPEESIGAAPSSAQYRDRTYESAVALREWFTSNHMAVTSFNLVTLGPHARRSRLLFEKAFEGTARVGVIALENREYDPNRWWGYSEGVKEVLSEGASYLYARLLFRPRPATP